jgi:hypothetical protein
VALAGSMIEQREGMQHLVRLWSNLEIDRVLDFGWKQAASLTGSLGRASARVSSTQLRWRDSCGAKSPGVRSAMRCGGVIYGLFRSPAPRSVPGAPCFSCRRVWERVCRLTRHLVL